jgi:DNA repair exonuclease SbcCD ATPase subunit
VTDDEPNRQNNRSPNGGTRPVPDPTVLTTEALNREIAGLERELNQRLTSVERELATRLEAASALGDEKFLRVEQQFELVERMRVEQKKDTKDAVDAALTAQKEAVKEQTAASSLATAKSETATNKQLEQLASTFTTAVDSLRRSNDEVKERIGEVDQSLRQSIVEGDRKTSSAISELRSRLDIGPPSLATLQSRSDQTIGRGAGLGDYRTIAFAVIGAAGTLAGIIAIIVAIASNH